MQFTGRWTTSYSVYTASSWPGTSVTILVYGTECTVKLRPQTGLGIVGDYGYYVSIDGGDDFKYDLPPFETGASLDPKDMTLYVPIKFEAHGDNFHDDRQPNEHGKLTPHTIRIMSDPHTPFRFEGIVTESTLTKQSWAWAKRQDERVTVEFIGEGIDAEQVGGMSLTGGWVKESPNSNNMVPAIQLLNTVQYQAAKRLGIRHWHTSAGVCLIDECTKTNPLPGLQKQYFHLNPLNYTRPLSTETNLLYSFNNQQPLLPLATPSHLVVDLGVADVLIHGINPEEYQVQLALFLEKLRVDAYPTAHIIVVARLDAQSIAHSMDLSDKALASSSARLSFPPDLSLASFRSTIQPGTDIIVLRKRLFDATKQAVKAANKKGPTEPKDGPTGSLTFVPIFDTGENQVDDLMRALCVQLGPASKPNSMTAQVCRGMPVPVHHGTWAWDFVLVVVVVAMVFVARETVIGAFNALVYSLRMLLHGGNIKVKGRILVNHGDVIEDLLNTSEKGWRSDMDKGKLR